MKNATRVASYVRDFGTMRNKFEQLDVLIRDAAKNKITAVIVQTPQVLGDNYDELVANLNALASADLSLIVVPPQHRT